MTAICKNLEIHVAHSCNLTCESCAHFSNQAHTGLLSLKTAEDWYRIWSPRLRPEQFSLLGGEPTLNKDLAQLVLLTRQYWRDSHIILVTNGFLLPRHDPQLPLALAQANVSLHLSIHFDSVEYEQRLAPAKALVEDWIQQYQIKVHWRPSEGTWTRRYHGWGPEMTPFSDGDQRASWNHCRARWCVQLHEGMLWKCPPLAYLGLQQKRHGLRPEWNRYLNYQPLSETCTDDELAEFLAREDEPSCEMCPAKPKQFFLQSPLVPVGTLLRTTASPVSYQNELKEPS